MGAGAAVAAPFLLLTLLDALHEYAKSLGWNTDVAVFVIGFSVLVCVVAPFAALAPGACGMPPTPVLKPPPPFPPMPGDRHGPPTT